MFKKSILVALSLVVLFSALTFAEDNANPNKPRKRDATKRTAAKRDDTRRPGIRGARRNRWPLAVQAYTFRKFTLFEAIEKAEECGLKFIEAYPNQVISKDILDKKGNPRKLWFNASDEVKKKIKAKLKKHKVKMVNFGVAGWIYEDEKGMKMVFDFLKDMRVRTFLVEPHKLEIVPLLDKFATEYKIKVGIHNHPPRGEKYKYWKPEGVLEALKGTSKFMGASPDVGHWVRSGLDPVEQLKKIKGKIVSVHIKDVSEFGVKEAKDVPLGTGKCKVKEILEELNKQGFRGVFTIEYESNPENPVPDVKKCVEYFKKAKAELKPAKRTKKQKNK